MKTDGEKGKKENSAGSHDTDGQGLMWYCKQNRGRPPGPWSKRKWGFSWHRAQVCSSFLKGFSCSLWRYTRMLLLVWQPSIETSSRDWVWKPGKMEHTYNSSPWRLRQEECVIWKVGLCFVVRKGVKSNFLTPEYRVFLSFASLSAPSSGMPRQTVKSTVAFTPLLLQTSHLCGCVSCPCTLQWQWQPFILGFQANPKYTLAAVLRQVFC